MSTKNIGPMRRIALIAAAIAASLMLATSAKAGDDHAYGVITVRGETGFTMMLDSGTPLVVDLSSVSKIKMGAKRVDASELIPGLRIKVEGKYDESGRLVAETVTFSSTDRKIAQAIKGGLTPTNQQVATNTEDIMRHGATLTTHGQALDEHGRTIAKQGTDIVANDLKMVATTGAIGSRIDNLGDYTVVDKMIVYFKHDSARVSPKFTEELAAFVAKAKGLEGYKIQVEGYASAVGSVPYNDALSRQRADAVTSVLAQQCDVPPTNLIAPVGLGIHEQFAKNKTAKGQAENRRVIVSILQNKAFVK